MHRPTHVQAAQAPWSACAGKLTGGLRTAPAHAEKDISVCVSTVGAELLCYWGVLVAPAAVVLLTWGPPMVAAGLTHLLPEAVLSSPGCCMCRKGKQAVSDSSKAFMHSNKALCVRLS